MDVHCLLSTDVVIVLQNQNKHNSKTNYCGLGVGKYL